MNNKLRLLKQFSLIAVILAWLVVGLGAYTRLMDAGLGCPDWPGCYGHFVVSQTDHAINHHKAWAEMIHRYFAGTLAILIIIVAGLSTIVATTEGLSFLLFGILLFALVVYQALLGLWTVTLKLLPIIVSQHLLGGMSILALLWVLHLKSRIHLMAQKQLLLKNYQAPEIPGVIKVFALLSLIVIVLQIALGAWTSTNYTALSCPHLFYCQLSPWHFDFKSAFHWFSPLGINYEGGQLPLVARMTIQVMHRFSAVVVFLSILALIITIERKIRHYSALKNMMRFLFIILILQICLGISAALFALPFLVGLAHNLVAALLLLSIITVNVMIFKRSSKKRIAHEQPH